MIGCGAVRLVNNAVAEPAAAGLEPAVHAPAGMEGPAEVNLRAVEDLDRVTARVGQLEHGQHAPLGSLVV